MKEGPLRLQQESHKPKLGTNAAPFVYKKLQVLRQSRTPLEIHQQEVCTMHSTRPPSSNLHDGHQYQYEYANTPWLQ